MSSTNAFQAYKNISFMLSEDIEDTLESVSIGKGKIVLDQRTFMVFLDTVQCMDSFHVYDSSLSKWIPDNNYINVGFCTLKDENILTTIRYPDFRIATIKSVCWSESVS